MSAPSVIFFSLFVVPLLGILVWLLRKDRKKGLIGLIVLALLVIGAVAASLLIASKSAMENAKIRQEETQEQEIEQQNNQNNQDNLVQP